MTAYYRGTDDAPHRDEAEAVELAAEAALAFARYLANIQGAADTGSMRVFWANARERYEEKAEEEFS